MKRIVQIHAVIVTLLFAHGAMALEFEATTAWANRVEVGAQVSGVITTVNVSAGQRINKGDLLLQLEQRYFKANYANTRAQVTSDKEALDEANRELERSLSLYEQTILAEHELQMAKNAHKKAQADYKKALAENVRAKMNLEYSSVHAPFDALVLDVPRRVGESVNARTETPLLLVIAEAGRMLALGAVAAGDISELKTGQKATVSIAGKSYSGTVISLGLEPMAGSNLYQVGIEFSTGDIIRAGSKASVSL